MEGGTMNFNEVEPETLCSVDSEVGLFIEAHFEELDQRSNRLARVLRSMGVSHGETIAVIVCDDTDRLVALAAIAKIGADVAECSCDLSASEFANFYRASGASTTLACSQGSLTWLASKVGGMILGDGEGVKWWKLAELRESSNSLFD
jgi:fatty-acyl-CoA synthase